MHALKTGDTHARANDSITLRDLSVPSTERSAFPIDSVLSVATLLAHKITVLGRVENQIHRDRLPGGFV